MLANKNTTFSYRYNKTNVHSQVFYSYRGDNIKISMEFNKIMWFYTDMILSDIRCFQSDAGECYICTYITCHVTLRGCLQSYSFHVQYNDQYLSYVRVIVYIHIFTLYQHKCSL